MPMINRRMQLAVSVAVALLLTTPVHADWLRFWGPNGSGVASSGAPLEFGKSKNLKWRVKLPGRGVSSPLVVGDKVFVTCYSGYGEEGGKVENLKRHLVCVDRKSGRMLWARTVDAQMPEDPWRPPGVTTHGYASNTPVSDGKHVFAFFGKSGVYAYDLNGEELWNQSVGRQRSNKGFGSAASPIVTDQHVIVNAADESLSIVWLDKKTGKKLFDAKANGLRECWTTPVLVKNGERSEIAISVIGEIWGLSNTTGKLSWYANGVNSRNAQVSLIVDKGTVYATGEKSYAVRDQGRGDVSKKNTVWQDRLRTRYATPVLVNGHLFSVSGPVVECVNAGTGKRVFHERLPGSSGNDNRGGRGLGGGGDFASPVAAKGKIYITMNSGMVHVIEAAPTFKVLASNDMTFDSSGFGGTPAISDDCLFLRSNSHLYCVGQDQ